MSSTQLVTRVIAGECKLAQTNCGGTLTDWEWQKLEHHLPKMKNAKLFIDDTTAISISELRGKCRRLAHENKIELI